MYVSASFESIGVGLNWFDPVWWHITYKQIQMTMVTMTVLDVPMMKIEFDVLIC